MYDLNRGACEYTAFYVNYANNSCLSTYGGTLEGDLYGSDTTEQSTSTKYKTVYMASGSSQSGSYDLLGTTGTIKKVMRFMKPRRAIGKIKIGQLVQNA